MNKLQWAFNIFVGPIESDEDGMSLSWILLTLPFNPMKGYLPLTQIFLLFFFLFRIELIMIHICHFFLVLR